MKQGDFTDLAKQYHNRAGYSEVVIDILSEYVKSKHGSSISVVDVGAGTGKLTENLLQAGHTVVAVEPNDAMREEGVKYLAGKQVTWRAGSAEATGLESSIAHWVLMGSSFHWVEKSRGLPELARILKPGGFFTAVWNPRDLERSELHSRIEEKIGEIVPELRRVSSGGDSYTKTMYSDLVSTGHFADPIFIESQHEVVMTKERYMGAWKSVNDIQAQAGPDRFAQILKAIEREIETLDSITIPYKTRSWTARRK